MEKKARQEARACTMVANLRQHQPQGKERECEVESTGEEVRAWQAKLYMPGPVVGVNTY